MNKLVFAASSALVLAACGSAAQAADLSIVYNFSKTGTMTLNNPRTGLTIDANGNLFGTAIWSGTAIQDQGGVYKLTRRTDGSYAPATTVVDFAVLGSAAQRNPTSPVTLDAAGNIYGALASGGRNGGGGVYTIAAGTSTVTTLATFVSGTAAGSTGTSPFGPVVRSANGTLWGANNNGGPGNAGTIYKVAPGSGVATTVANFGADGLSGGFSSSGLVADGKGNLYGSTQFTTGGSGFGTLFKVDTSTGTVTTLATFGAGTSRPYGSLAVDDAGNLFGTTNIGGDKNNGAVFKLAAGESTITTLASFDSSTTGQSVQGLIVDSVGNLFGVTRFGTSTGTAGGGAVWKLGAGSSTLETLASFARSGTGPRFSYGGLVADAQGNLYGTTAEGGTNNAGTVFKLANTGYGVAPTVVVPPVVEPPVVTPAAVPEPASWATMILGLGLAGAALRRRRAGIAFA